MSALDRADEFTDTVFTRDRAAWWADLGNIPGVNVCTGERLTVTDAQKRYLPWTVRKVQLYDPDTFEPVDRFIHKRTDAAVGTPPIGQSTGKFVPIQNAQAAELFEAALTGVDYAVASIGALNRGGITFYSVDFHGGPVIDTGGQKLLPYLVLINPHDGRGSIKGYGTAIRPECMNTISVGWLAGTQIGRLSHTTNVMSKLPQLQGQIRRYLDFVPKAEATVKRLIDAEVTRAEFDKIVEHLIPVPTPAEVGEKVKNQAAITRAETKRDEIVAMYTMGDSRVGFQGTAWGVFQAFSTWDQQERGFRRTAESGLVSREHSALTNHFNGKQEREDAKLMKGIVGALEHKPVKVTTQGLVLA